MQIKFFEVFDKEKTSPRNYLIKNLAACGILTGLFFIFTFYIRIPFGINANYINIIDFAIFILFSLTRSWYMIIPIILGPALADFFSGAIVYMPVTIIIKFLEALLLIFSFKKSNFFCIILSIFLAQILMLAGYFIWDVVIYHYSLALSDLLMNSIQASIVIIASISYLCAFHIFSAKNKHP